MESRKTRWSLDMDAAMKKLRQQRKNRRVQSGFTLIEVMISAVIVLIGLLAVLASFATAVASTKFSQEDMIAKQKALEALESIFTARNTQQIVWAQVGNVASGGIFKDGYQPLLAAGTDGLLGTADDVNFPAQGPCAAGPECIPLPGPDGILGTADDAAMVLANYQRQILIQPVLEADGVTVDPNLKQITVNVQYKRSQSMGPRTYTVNALISAFR
jgi:prepilin-type N-terminal cleavage/methylation domain-containing protein